MKLASKYIKAPGRVRAPNTTGPRRRMGTTSFEFAEDGVHSETILESGGPESNDTIIARYRRTGKHLGKFETPAAADSFARSLAMRAKKR